MGSYSFRYSYQKRPHSESNVWLSPEDSEGGARRISGGGGCRQNSEDKVLKKEQSRSGNWRTRKCRKALVLIYWFGLLLCVYWAVWWERAVVKGRKTSSDLSSGVTLASVLDGDPRGKGAEEKPVRRLRQ